MHNYLNKNNNILMLYKAVALAFALSIANNAYALVLTPDFEVQNIPNVGGLGSGVAVSFDNVYASPVPVCTYVLADIDDDPTTVRIDSLSMTGMTVYLQGPAGAALVAGNVHCIIMDEGDYTVAADGIEAEARLVDSNETNGNGDFVDLTQVEDVTADITGNYTNPVVVGQVITSNDPAFSTFWSNNCDTRQTPPFETSGNPPVSDICVGKHSSFIPNVSPAVATETIGYIVFEEANGVLNGIQFETERGSDSINGVDPNLNATYDLDNTYDYNFAVASQAAEDGGNGSWAVLYGADPLAGGIMNVAVDEANLAASTNARAHTNEQVDYIAFAASELTLEKDVINDDGGVLADTAFTLTADGPTIDVGSGDGTATSTSLISRSGVEGDGAITEELIYPSTYALSETTISGYAASAWSCVGGALAGGDITLAPGDDAVCTIINDDIAAQLTLLKVVNNTANGGTATVNDWTLEANTGGGVAEVSGISGVTMSLNPGDYILSELNGPSGYTQTALSCDAGTLSADTLSVGLGEEVTCTFTNRDLITDLTISKVVSDPNPSPGDTVTFTLTVVNNGPDDANNVTIDDTVLAGFTFVAGSMTGGDFQNQTSPNLMWTISTLLAGSANAFTLTYQSTVVTP